MTLVGVLTVTYLALFQCAALPAIARIYRRRSSHDCSVWREWLVLAGVALQFMAFALSGAGFWVLISPVVSALSLSALLAVVYRYR